MRLPPAVLLTLTASFAASAQTYTISTLAGGALPENIPGTSASLSPRSVAADGSGNLFFVNQNTVLRLDAKTGILTLAAGNGSTGFSGDNGPATGAQLYFPTGVAVDSAGNLYIADTFNLRIRKVANGVITTVAGNGVEGYSGDNGSATSARLDAPQDVAVDSAGNLYIADTGNFCVRKVSNGVITTVAGNGLQGSSGDNGPAANAELSGPYAIAADGSGNLYIADGARVRKVTNGVIATIAGTGTPGFSGDGGPAVSAQLSLPNGVAVDGTGNLYIADGARVRKVANGMIATVAGNGLSGFSGDGGPATSAELSGGNSGVAVDSSGDLYIADFNNNRIRKVANGVISTVAGGGTAIGPNGPVTSAQFGYPAGVALDSAGSLYVADEGSNVIWKIANGVTAVVAGNGTRGFSGDGGAATSAQLFGPFGVAVDSAGSIYISDSGNSRVRKVANGVITTVAGNGTPGFSGDNGPATAAGLYNPYGLALDSSGSLYIADSINQRIRKVTNGVITTVAGNGTCCSSGENNVSATGSTLSQPSGIAVDAAGNLYISDDFFDCRVLKVSNGVMTTVAGDGTDGISGDNGPATSAQFWDPDGIAVDSAGNLYIADPTNQRIRKVSNGFITTIAGNGAEGFSGDTGPAFNAQLSAPQGLAVDSSGNVYIADSGNQRIRLLTPAGSPSINNSGIVSAASPANHSPAVAGSIASVYGTFLAKSLSTATSSPLPFTLGGVSLEFGGGLSAPLFAVSGNQVNFQVPWELVGQSEASISALVDGQVSGPQTMLLSPVAPTIFSINGAGTGQGAVLDTSFRLVDSSNPATAGSTVIQIYCTGLGPVTNQPPSGSPPPSNLLSETTATPMVTIGGVQAKALFSGLAPGTVGEYQVNALVPAGSSKGAAIPVVIAFGPFEAANGVFYAGSFTSNTVTIAVQ